MAGHPAPHGHLEFFEVPSTGRRVRSRRFLPGGKIAQPDDVYAACKAPARGPLQHNVLGVVATGLKASVDSAPRTKCCADTLGAAIAAGRKRTSKGKLPGM